MIINLDSDKLEIGMFIILPDSLFDNPFWASEFVIENQHQIQKIIKSNLKTVRVDTEKSKLVVEMHNTNVIKVKKTYKDKKEPATSSDKWEPERFMSPQLVEAFKNTKMAPSDRSKIVNDYSREMMKNIIENPTAENITASKKGIAEIVDVIMNEDETCDNLVKIVSHDFYSYTHSVNVGIKSVLLAKEFYGDSAIHDMHELGYAFFLHDIGKIHISAEIINKCGRLTEMEMDEMRKHPEESKKILDHTNHLNKKSDVQSIISQHHERIDGSGYPLGLKGFDIHPYASICCIADVYDALTGQRSYKAAKPPKEALKIMTEQMSNHFNREMLNKFIELFERSGILMSSEICLLIN